MKALLPLLLLLLASLTSQAQAVGAHIPLTGYFIVDCIAKSFKNSCNLDIASLKAVDGDSMTCGDGAFYGNISSITYVAPQDIDMRYIDDFNYQVALQGRQHRVYLSTNPLILRAAGPAYASLRNNQAVVRAIEGNRRTAKLLQHSITQQHHNFRRKKACSVLIYGTLYVVVLPPRPMPLTYRSPLGTDQYLLLDVSNNRIQCSRVLKDPF